LNSNFSDALQSVSNIPDSTFFVANGPNIQGLTTNAQISPDAPKFLEYTIVPGRILYSPSLTDGSSITTAAGINVTITVFNGSTYVNNAKVTWKDILVANGVMHTIDMVGL
jgi:uncharacterized surface protein with fasciclin (FAS1) repeats